MNFGCLTGKIEGCLYEKRRIKAVPSASNKGNAYDNSVYIYCRAMIEKIPDKTTSTAQKAALIAFGLVLSVLLLEATLRLSGMSILCSQAFRNLLGSRKPGVYRIMCVGESTTQGQYPQPLEDILNGRGAGLTYRVIDVGRTGVDTTFLLQKLEDDLDVYAPDLVVVMMGINDSSKMLGGDMRPYHNLRVYRLIRLLYANLMEKEEPRPAGKWTQSERINTAGGPEFPTEAEYRKAIELDPNAARLYIRLAEFYYNRGMFPAAKKAYRELIGRQPHCVPAYCGLAYVLLSQNKPVEAERVLKLGLERDPDGSEQLYRALAQVYGILKKPRLSRAYSEKVEGRLLPSWSVITMDNYRKLQEALRKRKIKLIAVQYPMRSLGALKEMFQGREDDVVFVDNEKSFKKAVAESSYTKYFLDIFGGDFGHCTEAGNRLLAENIAAAILAQRQPPGVRELP